MAVDFNCIVFITALGYHHHGLSLPFHVSDTMTKWSEAESFRTRKERIFNSTRYSGWRFVKEGKQKVHGLAQFVAYCIIMCTLWASYVYSIQILFAGEDLAKTLWQYVKAILTPFTRPYSPLKINPRQNIGIQTTSNVEHPSIKKYDDHIWYLENVKRPRLQLSVYLYGVLSHDLRYWFPYLPNILYLNQSEHNLKNLKPLKILLEK